jgi:hypothetical protein
VYKEPYKTIAKPENSQASQKLKEACMASKRSIISEKAQNAMQRLDWQAAIREMERLFVLDRDPHIRVRIGDMRRKLNRNSEAVSEYLFAADLFVERGFTVKAIAQYNLVLRLDASHEFARSKIETLRACRSIVHFKREPVEYEAPQPMETQCSHAYVA